MDHTIMQSVRIVSLGATILVAGCATAPTAKDIPTSMNSCSQYDGIMQEARSQVKAVKSDMARVQIQAAKQKAELFSARQEIKSLRKTHVALQNSRALQREKVKNNSVSQTLKADHQDQSQFTKVRGASSPKVAHLLNMTPRNPLSENLSNRIERLETSIQQLIQHMQWFSKDSKLQQGQGPLISNTSEVLPNPHEMSDLSSSQRLSLSDNTAPRSTLHHIVIKPGDTLSKLSRQYGNTIQAIKELNHLNSDVIYIGQELVIPSRQQRENLSLLPTSFGLNDRN